MKGKKRRHEPYVIFMTIIYCANTFSLIIWMQEQTEFMKCPVSIFISLAFADNAFQDISTLGELLSFQLQHKNDTFKFKWREDKINAAILKCPDRKKGGVFNYRYWWEQLKNLSWRAGYCEYTRPYNIRRAVANRIHGE